MSDDGVLQDFEIAGSRTGVGSGDCAEGCECECDDSPQGTVHSWDSHANYRHRLPQSPDHSLFSGVILYCDHTHLKSPTGVVRILLVVSNAPIEWRTNGSWAPSKPCSKCPTGATHILSRLVTLFIPLLDSRWVPITKYSLQSHVLTQTDRINTL